MHEQTPFEHTALDPHGDGLQGSSRGGSFANICKLKRRINKMEIFT